MTDSTDPTPQPRADLDFVIIPGWVVRDPSLSCTAVRVLGCLAQTRTPYYAHGTIADWSGVSVPTVRRALTELVKAGAIRKLERRRRENGSYSTVLYEVALRAPFDFTSDHPRAVDDATSDHPRAVDQRSPTRGPEQVLSSIGVSQTPPPTVEGDAATASGVQEPALEGQGPGHVVAGWVRASEAAGLRPPTASVRAAAGRAVKKMLAEGHCEPDDLIAALMELRGTPSEGALMGALDRMTCSTASLNLANAYITWATKTTHITPTMPARAIGRNMDRLVDAGWPVDQVKKAMRALAYDRRPPTMAALQRELSLDSGAGASPIERPGIG